ncbi:hypothetical protein, conserved (fragment), partial [Trypanosoma vivax Y486]
MERVGVVFEASQKPTKGWVAPFTVVGEKPAWLRRRFVALPKGKNDHDDCEADAPLPRVPCYLHAAFGEVTIVFDFKASFFQVSLPQGNRASFRCRMETGMLVKHVRLPMGYKCSPGMLRTVARALAGDTAVMSSRCAALKSLKMRVWIDNIRTSGPRRGVEKRGRVATQNARQCVATLGE